MVFEDRFLSLLAFEVNTRHSADRSGAWIDEYDLLIEAMCERAAKDLKSKDYVTRVDAMDFFRSEWFRLLTDLDGEEIINRLLDD